MSDQFYFLILFVVFFFLPLPIFRAFKWIVFGLAGLMCVGSAQAQYYGGGVKNNTGSTIYVGRLSDKFTGYPAWVNGWSIPAGQQPTADFNQNNGQPGVAKIKIYSDSGYSVPLTGEINVTPTMGYPLLYTFNGSTLVTNWWANYSYTNKTMLNQWLLFRRTNDVGSVTLTDMGVMAPGATVDLKLTNGAWFGWALVDPEGNPYANGVASTYSDASYAPTNNAPYNPVAVADPIAALIQKPISGSLTNQSSDENTRQGFNGLVTQQAQIADKLSSNNIEGNGLLRQIATNTAALQGELNASATNKIGGFLGTQSTFASNQQWFATNMLGTQGMATVQATRVITNWATMSGTNTVWQLPMRTNLAGPITYVNFDPRQHKLWELSPWMRYALMFLAVSFACMTLWEELQDHLFQFYKLGGRMTGVTWGGILYMTIAAGVAGMIISYIVTSVAGAWMDTALMGGNVGIFSDAAAVLSSSWCNSVRAGASVIGDFLPLKEMLVVYSGYWSAKVTMGVTFVGWGAVARYIM